jgi:hypothetical protein
VIFGENGANQILNTGHRGVLALQNNVAKNKLYLN